MAESAFVSTVLSAFGDSYLMFSILLLLLLLKISQQIFSVMTEKFLKNEQIHPKKNPSSSRKSASDFFCHVSVDHCMRAFEQRRISDRKSPRKSAVIFPLMWQEYHTSCDASQDLTPLLVENRHQPVIHPWVLERVIGGEMPCHINQLELEKRYWNLETSSAVVEFLPPYHMKNGMLTCFDTI